MSIYNIIATGLLVVLCCRVPSNHNDIVKSIKARLATTCVSHDGKTIVSAYGTDVRIWKTSTLEEEKSIRSAVYNSRYLDFSKVGNFVVVAGDIKSVVEVWDINDKKNPKLYATLDPKSTFVFGVAISPNGKYVAILGGKVQIWDVQRKKKIVEFREKGSSILHCRFSPDGKVLAIGTSLDGEVTLWSLEKKISLAKINLKLGCPRWFEFHPDNELLFIGEEGIGAFPNKGGGIGVYDIKEKKLIRTLQMSVQGLSLSSDGKLLAASEPAIDHSVLFLDAKNLRPVHRIKNIGHSPKDVHFSDNDRKLVVRANRTLEVIDLGRVWRLLHKL